MTDSLSFIVDSQTVQPGAHFWGIAIEELVARGGVFADMTIEGLAR